MMSLLFSESEESHFGDTFGLALTGNDSQASSQLSRLKDKNQLWIHCDERRVDTEDL